MGISINNLFLKPLTTILKQSCLENKEVFHKRIKLETQIQNKHINTNISSCKKIIYLRLIKCQKKLLKVQLFIEERLLIMKIDSLNNNQKQINIKSAVVTKSKPNILWITGSPHRYLNHFLKLQKTSIFWKRKQNFKIVLNFLKVKLKTLILHNSKKISIEVFSSIIY